MNHYREIGLFYQIIEIKYISTNQPQPLKFWRNKLKINPFGFFRFVRPSDWLLLLLRIAFSYSNVEGEKNTLILKHMTKSQE